MRVPSCGLAVVLVACGALLMSAPACADPVTEALDTPVTISFENTDLRTVLQHLNEFVHINFVVDNRAVPADSAGSSANGYVTDGKIRYLNLKDVALSQALKTTLTPLGLDYSVQKNYIWISSPDRIAHETFEDLETRIYVIEEDVLNERNAALAQAGMPQLNLDSLVIFLSGRFPRIIEPATNRLLSYARFNLQTKQLVIHNTPTNHKKIEQILDLLFKSGEGIGPSGAAQDPPAPPA